MQLEILDASKRTPLLNQCEVPGSSVVASPRKQTLLSCPSEKPGIRQRQKIIKTKKMPEAQSELRQVGMSV
jgi:hypothetical protein